MEFLPCWIDLRAAAGRPVTARKRFVRRVSPFQRTGGTGGTRRNSCFSWGIPLVLSPLFSPLLCETGGESRAHFPAFQGLPPIPPVPLVLPRGIETPEASAARHAP